MHVGECDELLAAIFAAIATVTIKLALKEREMVANRNFSA